MNPIFLLIISYLLGAFPSGFLFTKIFAKKNILEIGWRKSSASNVFKNVGILPGVLTAIFDVGKGALAVFLAKIFKAPLEIQALCGVFAILGHNWSIFLKFSGGRGIGTFLGALSLLNFRIFLYSVVPFLFLVFIFDSSILTIFLLIFSLFLSFLLGEAKIAKFFILFSLFPIFLKRLSPIGELSLAKKRLILSRILFDDENFHHLFKLTKLKKLRK